MKITKLPRQKPRKHDKRTRVQRAMDEIRAKDKHASIIVLDILNRRVFPTSDKSMRITSIECFNHSYTIRIA